MPTEIGIHDPHRSEKYKPNMRKMACGIIAKTFHQEGPARREHSGQRAGDRAVVISARRQEYTGALHPGQRRCTGL